MKKEIPILFSTMMVQALLDGRKTQTRRILKAGFSLEGASFHSLGFYDYPKLNGTQAYFETPGSSSLTGTRCPYGKPGDILYVRESHYRFGRWEQIRDKTRKNGKQKWQFVEHSTEVLFEAPNSFRNGMHNSDPDYIGWYKRNSLFLPKAASRIWLQVESVRVERLQDITWMDATKEGITREMLKGADPHIPVSVHILQEFKNLWGIINSADSWEANPWLWVVTFKVLSTTGRPAEIEQQLFNPGVASVEQITDSMNC